MMPDAPLVSVLNGVIARSDLADLVLLAWAMASSGSVVLLLRELKSANARFEEFIRELHRFNSQQD